mmetsp:Transcript_8492/g.9340  ORF Transcript_8492/g.9340 Transcript_8492/m.9340 type:complete len:636 (-) Transcript_8492:57-1964(-)
MSPPAAPAATVQRAPLDVYKKIAVVRSSEDSVVYEDAQGKLQRITGLGDEALSANPSLQPKVKFDIPVPQITVVGSYEKDVPANYEVPRSYVRYCRPSAEEIENIVEYNLDLEDENWLANHPRFGTNINVRGKKKQFAMNTKSVVTSVGTNGQTKKKMKWHNSQSNIHANTIQPSLIIHDVTETDTDSQDEDGISTHIIKPTLPLSTFEHMLDLLEKATAFETIITLSQSERLILGKIPSILHIFGSSGATGPTVKTEKKKKKNPVTVRNVINDVYNYWVQKRSKMKKPLLRKYWPVTASNDTNPHLVFRPREKEKYKLRKKRQNDYDAYRKMKQLRIDFVKVRVLLDLIRKREQLNKTILDIQCDWFEQRVYDLVDTSGLPRESDRLCHEELKTTLDIPTYFDTQSLEKGKKRKRKKSSNSKEVRPSPATIPRTADPETVADNPTTTEKVSAPSTRVVADQEHPPLFLHPLETRESYVTSWDNSVPFVTSYVNSHPTPTFRFRHRPRVGRGGRIIIDRLPRPGNPDIPPVSVFTAGDESRLYGPSEPRARLLDLLPEPLDHDRLSRRIEEISAAGMCDDEEKSRQPKNLSLPVSSNANTIDEENDGEEVLVKVCDWMETDEQLWGEELFAIGPV